MSRVRVYMACSLDGFIAGEGDDLSWLGGTPTDAVELARSSPDALSYDRFISDVGVLLMGRRTYDVVEGFDEWFYGALPVRVATTRPLPSWRPSVMAVQGDIATLVEDARKAAGGKDVYLDGGDLIRQATVARLVDEYVITFIPVLLGRGIPLFAGLSARTNLEILSSAPFAGGALQVVARLRS